MLFWTGVPEWIESNFSIVGPIQTGDCLDHLALRLRSKRGRSCRMRLKQFRLSAFTTRQSSVCQGLRPASSGATKFLILLGRSFDIEELSDRSCTMSFANCRFSSPASCSKGWRHVCPEAATARAECQVASRQSERGSSVGAYRQNTCVGFVLLLRRSD